MATKKTLLLCSCDKTQPVDINTLKAAIQAEEAVKVDQLCTNELGVAVQHLSGTNDVLIACGQQATLFERLADEIEQEAGQVAPLDFIDLRDRAGWAPKGAKSKRIAAKQSALLAASQLPNPIVPLKNIVSDGVCCIVGPTELCVRMAELVQEELGVTCVVNDSGPISLPSSRYDVAKGQLKSARGALGCFELEFANLQTLNHPGRGAASYTAPNPSANSSCDVFIDLRGGEPAFPSHEKRNGYFWADPDKKGELERIALVARERVGEFEKSVYYKLDTNLCAHSRASKVGCTRCLDVCPTEAIYSAGDFVQIDSNICAGCGTCASVCPTSAIDMNESPFESITQALSLMAKTYTEQTKEAPRLLVHTAEQGYQTIARHARHADGLADDLIPFAIEHTDRFGHAEMLAALGAGFAEVLLLADSEEDAAVLEPQLQLTHAMLTGASSQSERIRLVSVKQLSSAAEHASTACDPVLLLGGRRDITRVTAAAITTKAGGSTDQAIALPTGAPYGAIEINSDKCTLCLACVSLCPTGALADHPDRPEVQFTENACVQCGVCESTCPETAIQLIPQLELSKSALEKRALHGEDPFECISCGKPFGVASTINRIVEKLEGNHWMYTNTDNLQLVKMCDDCRVKAQYHGESSPMAMGERPRVRTTDDYLDS